MGDDDDLRSDIAAALDEQIWPEGGGEPPEPKPQEKDDPFPRAEDMPKSGREYVRDGRRFVPKEGKEGAEPATPAAPAAKTWRPVWLKDEHGVDWEKTPEQFRKALEQREKEFAQGIEKHATPAKNWSSVEEHFAPYKAQIEQNGSSVAQVVDGLINDYKALALGDVDTKLATLDRLCATFFGGRSIEQLAYELQQQGYKPPPQPDPYVRQLEQKLAQLEKGLSGIQMSAKEQQQAALQAEIASFAKDKPDFETLRPIMHGLMVSGQAATLQEAYEQAQWAHPETRERILRDQRKTRVNRARAGAISPHGAPVANGASRTTPKLSLREEIAMNLDGGEV